MQNQAPFIPIFDIHKIEAIRSRLDDDNYIVDCRQIADKIIDLEKALAETA
ncbi:MAG: flagellar biosynthesis anti-sigma factor FlgM [Gammaproteobacteria bacterium]|jgi:anti-sigma28 factor (negative regulator of flagellin synthesis)